ncbi:ATP-dependent DNA ligase, partial [Mycolicibacterium diernhoferi]
MLAKAQTKVPTEAGVWSFEPKWDGFRALVFRDGDDVVLLSRSGKDLGRYFP